MCGRPWPISSPTPSRSPRGRHVSWREFDRGADGVARYLLDLGVVQQDKVALYLYNCPEYLQACFAAIKIGLVPVNTNYRYGDDELSYLWDNADAVAVVFHGAFSERIERIMDRVPVRRLALGRRRLGPLPGLGHALRRSGQVGLRPARRPPGAAAATTSS
jgi:acyl-coenzyme A synthetase/AMP-(fatty) acid ligase